jgi:ribulose-5-phosphate 4-epimerase/fuculose-1-phosphate aldolase
MLHRGGCDSGVAGHVSERDGDRDAFWISPFGYFDETTPDMVQRYDFDMQLLDAGHGIDA